MVDKASNRGSRAAATGPCVTSAHDGCTASITEIDVPQTTRLISCTANLAPVATSSPCQTTVKRVHGICSTTLSLRHLRAWPQHDIAGCGSERIGMRQPSVRNGDAGTMSSCVREQARRKVSCGWSDHPSHDSLYSIAVAFSQLSET